MAYRILVEDDNLPEAAPEPARWYNKLWPW